MANGDILLEVTGYHPDEQSKQRLLQDLGEAIRLEMLQGYRDALAALRAPAFPAPGGAPEANAAALEAELQHSLQVVASEPYRKLISQEANAAMLVFRLLDISEDGRVWTLGMGPWERLHLLFDGDPHLLEMALIPAVQRAVRLLLPLGKCTVELAEDRSLKQHLAQAGQRIASRNAERYGNKVNWWRTLSTLLFLIPLFIASGMLWTAYSWMQTVTTTMDEYKGKVDEQIESVEATRKDIVLLYEETRSTYKKTLQTVDDADEIVNLFSRMVLGDSLIK